MERRELFQGLGLAALTGLAGKALAQASAPEADPHAHHHHHHAASGPSALTTAAADCLSKGEACLAHCLVLLGQGDKQMAGCAQSVNQMLAICNALHKLSAQNASQLKAMARLAASVCDECEKECRKHADKHAECKACADGCVECSKQCKAVGA
jgi:Cys-rich four helix bundle protein (predicted Tat secretion target)